MRAAVEARGLNWAAMQGVFLCPRFTDARMFFLPDCPPVSMGYQRREAQAAGQSLLAIAERCVTLPDPWTGRMQASTLTASLTDPDILGGLYFAPLVYGFGSGDHEVWAVSCDLTGRIVHLSIPALDLVFYEVSEQRAATLEKGLQRNLPALRERMRGAPAVPAKMVAVVDMVWNFAHQMINHFSGIELMIERGLHHRVDEVWVSGLSFFGAVETLYPEIAGKLRVFADRATLAQAVLAEPVCAVRIGANCFFASTRERLLRLAATRRGFPSPGARRPLVAVTVRTAGRRCLNLDEVVGRVYERLHRRHPGLAFVVDGWVFAEGEMVAQSSAATCLDAKRIAQMAQEFADAREVFRHVPSDAIVRNVVGTSILESILGLLDVDAYLAHVGTLQHKIAFFSLKGGVVHGPSEQLTRIDSGAFQAELGPAPTYLDAAMVEDVPGDTPRGPSFRDYRVIDIEGCVGRLDAVIAGA